MAGIGTTQETRGRTITKTLTGYEGKRYFAGPQTTFVSDLGKVANSAYIGAHWPKDFATSGWTLVSNASVTQIDLTYKFAQVDAEAVVTYSSEPRGGGGGKDLSGKVIGTYYDELTTTAEALDVGAVPKVKAVIVQSKDAEGNDITDEDILAYVPTCVATRYYWYGHIPSFAGVYTMTGKINSSTFMGASPSFLLCTGASVRQIETAKWEGQFTFQMSPVNQFGARHWNQVYTDADGNYIPLQLSANFRTSRAAL